jgi:hypothetical protein
MSCRWPNEFLPQDLVTLTGGIIGRPTAYAIAKEIGVKRGKGMVIKKIEFFKWFLGAGNIFVQDLMQNAERGEAAGASRGSDIPGSRA